MRGVGNMMEKINAAFDAASGRTEAPAFIMSYFLEFHIRVDGDPGEEA